MVVGAAVIVVLAIGLVVFAVVAGPVVQRKTVMGGDEVDAGPGAPAFMVEAIARGQEPRRKRCGRCLAAPVIAHGVAEFVVPFRPARRKFANLVTAGSGIPRLGDQFDGAQQRVLIDRFQETALLVKTVDFAGEDG